MVRGKASGGISGIGNPGITGAFTRFEPPAEVAVGQEIKIVVDGDLYDYSRSPTAHWNGAFTAEGNGHKDCTTFDGYGTKIGPEVRHTLKLGPMPDHVVDIEVKLWGNSSAWAYMQCPPGF